jgi:competence CoiA-like predicted nuclease
MTIIAIDSKGTKYNSLEIEDRKSIKSVKFICPNCSQKLMFVDSIIKIKHFRHYGENNCSTEPDTEQHNLFKKQIHDIMINKGYACEYEKRIGDRVADIYGEKGIIKLAVECQISPISPEELADRDYNYRTLGYETLWIFHLSNYANFLKYDCTKNNGYEFAVFSLRRVEREFNGDLRIRYFDGTDIIKIKFSSRKRWVKEEDKKEFIEENYKTQGILWTALLKEERKDLINRIIKLQENNKEGENNGI